MHEPFLPTSSNWIAVLAVFFGAALAWVVYFRAKDDSGATGLGLSAVAVAGGMGSVALALAGFGAFEHVSFVVDWSVLHEGPWNRAFAGALVIGFVEEVSKLVPVVPVALAAKRFNRRLDGVLYAACAGIGFATAESVSLWWGGQLTLVELVARALAAPVTHALLAAPWGLGLIAALRGRQPWRLPLGLGISVLAHAAYNLGIARAHQAVSAPLVLALWVWLLWTAPRLRTERVSRA